jgi:magnesium-transporting ATPase (P-type)
MKVKVLTYLTVFAILSILVLSKHAYAYCYDNQQPHVNGQKILLHEQSIYGVDCFTGRFDESKSSKNEYNFDFNTFRFYFLLTIFCLILDVLLLYMNKKILSALMNVVAFLSCIFCALYFDKFHNYYTNRFEEFHSKGVSSITFDVEYYWLLSNPLIWVIFFLSVVLHVLPIISGKLQRSNNNQLLDN